VVSELSSGGWLATVDVVAAGNWTEWSETRGFGWTFSGDRVDWQPAVDMIAVPGGARTPLGMVEVRFPQQADALGLELGWSWGSSWSCSQTPRTTSRSFAVRPMGSTSSSSAQC
jgi:hypothetical protein